MNKKILIIDAFPAEIRETIESNVGKHGFGEMLAKILDDLMPTGIDTQVVNALDAAANTEILSGFDGFVWSGSNLSALDETPDVKRTEEWMAACAGTGKPIFGICYGLQLAVKMAGGRIERNSKGRETVVARKINLSGVGEKHPMMDRRDDTYDAIADHTDHITELPKGGLRLAGNEISDYQAAALQWNGCEFWGVQITPTWI